MAGEADIQKEYEALLASGDVYRLWCPGHAISPRPIYSEGYMDCNGVALFTGKVCCLTHYDLAASTSPAGGYFKRVLDSIHYYGSDIKAVVFGGERRHHSMLLRMLEAQGIPVIGSYVDGFDPGEGLADHIDISQFRKSAIALSSEQAVLLHSPFAGYLRLGKEKQD